MPVRGSTELLIGGRWRPAEGDATVAAWSPATGEQLGQVAEGTRADARAAVDAARDAFRAWAAETAFARARALHRIADECARRREDLAHAATLDQGKPLTESFDEVDELVAMWRGAAEDGVRLEGSIPPSSSPGKRVLVLRRAVGPVAVVTPWNWPYTMPAEIVAPALAVGNTVVWTPAPITAYCSALLAECVAEADLPPGVFNFVTGPGPVVGDELVGHPDVSAVGFIGSTATGLRIAARAAGKRLLLEMGGNGPLVVLEDADLEAAADAAVVGCFLCAGQSCTAGERLLAHERVREEFVSLLAARLAAGAELGDPLLEGTGARAASTTRAWRRRWMPTWIDAVERGKAGQLPAGQRAAGFLYRSFTGPRRSSTACRPDALAATEETFGPIAPIIAIDSLERAIELTNASPYGLLAAIFTRDLSRGLRFADEARTGLVNINETTNYWENHLPFGGRAGSLTAVSGGSAGRYPFDALDGPADGCVIG